MRPDNTHAEASSHDRTSTKRPYRAPTLRELGTVADLTYTAPPYSYEFDQEGYQS
jgi:hypothetical protein